MLFGFFSLTDKTFKLTQKKYSSKSLPELCSSGSPSFLILIPPLDRVFPSLVSKKDLNAELVPLFAPATIDKNKTVNILDPLAEKSKIFCLIFYPDPDKFPAEDLLIKEYWSTIKPMIICRDIGGYYLGCPEDENIIFFKQCQKKDSECWICRCENIDNNIESNCYAMAKEINLSEEKIYLQKVTEMNAR